MEDSELVSRATPLLVSTGIALRDTKFYTDAELESIKGISISTIYAIRQTYPLTREDEMEYVVIYSERSRAVQKTITKSKVFPNIKLARAFISANSLQLTCTLKQLVSI